MNIYFCNSIPSSSQPIIVNGLVFDDVNENGVRDSGEPGISYVTRILLRSFCPSISVSLYRVLFAIT